VLRASGKLFLRVTGWSMLPTIWPGDVLVVESASRSEVREGDIVLFTRGGRFVAHRVLRTGTAEEMTLQTRGDALWKSDAPVSNEELQGRVFMVLRNGKRVPPKTELSFAERLAASVFQRSEITARAIVRLHGARRSPRVGTN